jgi:hypothetical protein
MFESKPFALCFHRSLLFKSSAGFSMKRAKPDAEGKGPLDLLEESVHLLRQAPASALASYYLGSLPFVLALLYFWSDMARSAFAEQRLAGGAFALALLFLWMKTWQAVFARQLLARLCGEPVPRWTWQRWVRAGAVQAILQPSGLFLLPAALVVLAPFGWVYAFYQNVTALGGGEEVQVKSVFQRAVRQSRLWPMQHHYALFTMKLFGLFVFLNLATGLLAAPFLLKTLLGIETAFVRSPLLTLLNTTFFAVLFGLTYLCLDPLLKTFYVLRCFYGDSLQTGQDLTAELRRLHTARPLMSAARLTALLALLFSAPLPSKCAEGAPAILEPPRRDLVQAKPIVSMLGQEIEATAHAASQPPLAPPELNRAIEQVLQQREYTWRLPRDKIAAEKEKGLLAAFVETVWEAVKNGVKAVGRWISAVINWIMKWFRPQRPGGGSGFGWMVALRGLLLVLAVGLVFLLVWLLLRLWRNRRPAEVVAATALAPVPDVSDENVGADHLPGEGWLRMAQDLLARGELRLALRALFFASLAHLSEQKLIIIAKFKSNRDYAEELQRRSHAVPQLAEPFLQNVSLFDRTWYGLHEVRDEVVRQFARNVERIRGRSDESRSAHAR